MPPKVRFSREEIIAAALDIVREGGMTALTARSLAARLGSSAKPVFGLFENMQEVQTEVMLAANTEYQSFLRTEMMRGIYKPYKASGMAYIAFARKEKELFRLLFMRDRTAERIETEDASLNDIIEIISRNTGLSEEDARLFHLEMWIFVHGIATMIVTNYLDWEEEHVSRALTDAYEGLKTRWCGEEKE
mgnify:CR=1 FL=1